MKLARVDLGGETGVAAVQDDGTLVLLDLGRRPSVHTLSDLLHAPDPPALVRSLWPSRPQPVSPDEVRLLAPVDRQEVWAAGVTYKRSREARMKESKQAASHYDRVYEADRPELFFKATPHRVVGPGKPIRVRADSRWTVPEPELALVVSPDLRLVGYTVGNDVSARDIEGENPLYLPQAKVYNQCCALGPWVLLADEPLDLEATQVRLTVERAGRTVFEGETRLSQMARTFDELLAWLGRDNTFPDGVVLLTGTGIVPPDDFTLQAGDCVSIEVSGIGTLTNPVVKATVPGSDVG